MHAKFKKTPIGEIPEDWQVVKLGKIIGYTKGKKPKMVAKEPKDGWLPYLSTEYLRNNNPTQFVKITGNEIIVEDGDILLLWDGSNAGEFFLAKKGVLSSTMVKIFLKKHVYDSLFLFYLLKHREPFLKGQTKGTGIPHVDKNVLNALLLPLPPLEEQKQIAEILRTVDEAIEKTDLAIEKTERLKKGLMQRLLTKGIKHKRFKKTEIGEIPEEWRVVRIGEVTGLFQYGLSIKMHDKGKYPIIKMDSIINGEVKPVNIKYVDLDEDTFKKYRLEKGDILINRTNSYELVGRTGVFMLDGDYVFASYLIRIRPDKKQIDPRFLTFYLIFANDKLRQLATRAVSQANINASNLKKFKIPLPPLEEQKQIAEILMTVDKKLELLRKRKEKLERIKRGLMKDLLTGRRRVKV
ncbi:restriction endonuclease subunit S [Thermococcus barophilus]|uniref:Type I restriction-modification system specificity subunit S n=1 Tax=Thermococcus barophilus (strain DSM 11836 / MP) TaxID=391623 RepID=F0LIW6_THEBM|nr:restriction endonuclease subunit S [Thermococcus barophilus]ADT84568.1 Type I restriction-modification system specificity subunit S [Thermococcus barophilus MP]